MTKRLLTGSVGALMLLCPLFASATQTSDLQTQIQSLLAQVALLQARLQAAQATPDAPTCLIMSTNLSPGATGSDVTRLQTFLANQGPQIYPEGKVTAYYGSLTTAAVSRWQYAHGIPVTGKLDTTTLVAMNCGTMAVNEVATSSIDPVAATPVILLSSSLTSLQPGQGTTLSWNVSHASRCTLNHDDETESIGLSGYRFVIPAQTTTYSIRCANDVGIAAGPSNQQSITVTIARVTTAETGSAPTCTLSVSNSSPAKGNPVTLTWTSKNADYASKGYQTANGNASVELSHLAANGSTAVTPMEPLTYILFFYGSGPYTTCRISVSPQ